MAGVGQAPPRFGRGTASRGEREPNPTITDRASTSAGDGRARARTMQWLLRTFAGLAPSSTMKGRKSTREITPSEALDPVEASSLMTEKREDVYKALEEKSQSRIEEAKGVTVETCEDTEVILKMLEDAKWVRIKLLEKEELLKCQLEDSRKMSTRRTHEEYDILRYIAHWENAVQDLRADLEFVKNEFLKMKVSHSKDLDYLGLRSKALAGYSTQNYSAALAENKRLFNRLQELKGNIRVYCRIRPFPESQSTKQTIVESIGDNGEITISNPKHRKDSSRLFKFNKVFSAKATQEEVFLDTQPLIRSVMDGFNVCILAYGPTGSGKTYTMSGPSNDWGVNCRALSDLFKIAQSNAPDVYEFALQMIEVYNEQVRDLLANDGPQKRLGISTTTDLDVPEASMHHVRSTSDVLQLMSIGSSRRAVGATALNESSSSSHSVLIVHVKKNGTRWSRLYLVDLAGSERFNVSEAIGDKQKEGQHINRSLSALGDVMCAIAQKKSYVPYRNSKLTRVLKSSLGGRAKTVMYVHLNLEGDSYSKTVNTLNFAQLVAGIELGAAPNNQENREQMRKMPKMMTWTMLMSLKAMNLNRKLCEISLSLSRVFVCVFPPP